MNSELFVPGKTSCTKPYCGKRGCGATDTVIPTSYAWDSDEETRQSTKPPKNTNELQLFLKTRNGNIRSTWKQSNHKAAQGAWNEATQSGPLTQSQIHQAQNTAKHIAINKVRLGQKGNTWGSQ
jgi:hypothetical protein